MKKKWLWGVGISLLTVVLVGCGKETDTKTSGTSDQKTEQTTTSKKLAPKEVLAEAQKNATAIKSGELTTTTAMTMDISGKQTASTTVNVIQFTSDPFMTKTESTIKSGDTEMKATSYMDKSNMYFQTPGADTWQVQELSALNINVDDLAGTFSNASTYTSLEDVADSLTAKEAGETYVLEFSGSGDEITDLVLGILEQSGSSDDAASHADSIKVNSFTYSCILEKETFLPISFESQMDYEIASEDDPIKSTQTQSGSYDKINQIDAIELPAEVTQ